MTVDHLKQHRPKRGPEDGKAGLRPPATARIFRTLMRLVAAALVLLVMIVPVATAQTVPGLSDVSLAHGLNDFARTYSVTVADVDGQNGQDIFVVNHDPQTCCPQPILYYSNADGSFTASPFVWPTKDRHGCAFHDFNADGLTDLGCAIGYSSNSNVELDKNLGSGPSKTVSQQRGTTSNSVGRYRTLSWLDANHDGRIDFYVSHYAGPGGNPPTPADDLPNQLWLQQSDKTFVVDTSMGITKKDSAFKDADSCNFSADINADGYDDLVYCSPEGLKVWVNNGGVSFTDETVARGLVNSNTPGAPVMAQDAEFGDLNGDGFNDFVIVNATTMTVFTQNPASGTFSKSYTHAVVSGLNLAVGDVDGDGFKDIYTVGSCSSAANTRRSDTRDFLFKGVDGLKYSPTIEPALANGCGDDVRAVDVAGHTDFVVVNGRRHIPGPTQLLEWTP